MKLNENINRIKQMMGLILEEYIVNSQIDFIKLLSDNGFVKPTEQQAKDFFAPSSFTMSNYEWILLNFKTMAFVYKTKDGVFIGYQKVFIPKENKIYDKEFNKINGYPIDINYIKKYITNPRNIDTSYDINSLVNLLDSTRDSWNGFKLVGNTIKYGSEQKTLDDNIKKSISNGIKNNLNKVNTELNKLPEDIKNSKVTTQKYGETYNSIKDYISKIESEAKDLKLI